MSDATNASGTYSKGGSPSRWLGIAGYLTLIVGGAGAFMLIRMYGDGLVAPAAPAACRQIGQQCQRPEGPLGVCQETKCGADASPPCYVCTSQH